jgi:diguanylate cyclase (GGDEF)-like protein/PAS domain S-box-containing protein
MEPDWPQNPVTPNDPAFYKGVLDHISDGVYFVDRERRILYWNEGAHRLTGYKAKELLGRHCQDDILCHIDSAGVPLCKEGCLLAASIADGGQHEANVFLRHKQGRRVPVNVRVQPMRGADGSVIGAVGIFSDDSTQNEIRHRAEALNRMAFLDHLSELPNRRFLEMSICTALNEFQVHKDPFGVLLIDLDRFKSINDSFGHSCGDRALLEVARTLAGALRPTDSLGRWGGDEFLAIVRNVDRESLSKLAERRVALAAQTKIPYNGEGRISMSISVGAALVRPGETAEEVIQRADELMYQGKASGRGRARVE